MCADGTFQQGSFNSDVVLKLPLDIDPDFILNYIGPGLKHLTLSETEQEADTISACVFDIEDDTAITAASSTIIESVTRLINRR